MMAPEWVSLKEAAARLGVSQDTIRRKLKRGELEGRKAATPQGFTWEVLVPAVSPASEPSAPAATPAEDALELARLRERVAGLERERGELIAQRDAWQEQARRSSEGEEQLRELVARAQLLAQALPATVPPERPPDAPESPRTRASDAQDLADSRSQRPRLWRWWKRAD